MVTDFLCHQKLDNKFALLFVVAVVNVTKLYSFRTLSRFSRYLDDGNVRLQSYGDINQLGNDMTLNHGL